MATDMEKSMKLIKSLEERPQLWKKEHKDFTNRDIRKQHFYELSKLSGLSEEDCRKRLKHYKDKMRSLCQKLPRDKLGQPDYAKGEEIFSWPYYSAMLFMRDQFTAISTRDIINGEITMRVYDNQEDSMVSHYGSDGEKFCPSESGDSLDAPSVSRETAPPVTSKKARMAEEFFSLERERMANMRKILEDNDPPDEWAAFSGSLMCDLHKLKDPLLIMQVKSDINKIVHEAVITQLKKQNEAGSSNGIS